jgi:hypothetical protein
MKQWIFSGGCLGVLFLAAPLLRAQDPDELLAVRFPARHGYITWPNRCFGKCRKAAYVYGKTETRTKVVEGRARKSAHRDLAQASANGEVALRVPFTCR